MLRDKHLFHIDQGEVTSYPNVVHELTIIDFDKYEPLRDRLTSDNVKTFTCSHCINVITEYQLNVLSLHQLKISTETMNKFLQPNGMEFPFYTVEDALEYYEEDGYDVTIYFTCPFCLYETGFLNFI